MSIEDGTGRLTSCASRSVECENFHKAADPTTRRHPPLFPFSIAFTSSRFDDRQMSHSIRNKITGIVREITSEKVLSEIIIDTTIGPLAAVITTRSVRDMQLKIGDSVSALVKATNVSIEKDSSK
jgi:molybdopterin-binding protein